MYKALCYTSIFCLLLFIYIHSTYSILVSLTGNGWIINSNDYELVAQGSIPGTFHTILLAANRITEPYFRYNDLYQRNLIYESWTFRKNFSLTNDILTLSQFQLHCDQIDTVANITLNECFIGQTNSMFIPYVFHIGKNARYGISFFYILTSVTRQQ